MWSMPAGILLHVDERVVALAAGQDVGAAEAADGVVAVAADEHVIVRRALVDIVEGRADDLLDARRTSRPRSPKPHPC